MRFDLTDLRLFLHVVEAGSITHGARLANLALPSASERLRGMEEVSGVRLLERRRRGVEPTAAGEGLAHHARIVLRQFDRMRAELSEYAKGLKGSIRLLANTAAIAEFLPDVLARYLANRPHIDIDLNERLSTETVKAVAGGIAEIGIISDAVDAGTLQLLPFALDRLVLVVPSGHPLAEAKRMGAKRMGFRDATEQAFVGLTKNSALQEHIDEDRCPRRRAFGVSGQGADLRRHLQNGGAQRRGRHRAADRSQEVPPVDGNSDCQADRPLGDAPSDDLLPQH